jgi:hypothetical protein
MNIPNNLSALLPTFFFAAQMIQREATAGIESVSVNSALEQLAVGMTATYPIAPAATAYDISAGTIPNINGEKAGSGTLSISKSRALAFEYTGEEQRQLAIAGVYSNHYLNQILERMRTLRNEVEADVVACYSQASRAVGTAGTAPFAVDLAASPTVTGMEPFAKLVKEMTDMGCPGIGRSLILNSTAAAKLRNVPNLYRANEAGDNRLLRTGELGIIENFRCGESGQVKAVSAVGTAAATYRVDGAVAKGGTSIKLKTGSGTILAGDVFSLTSSSGRLYVALTAAAAAGDTITIARPGVADAIADGDTLTLAAAFTPNLALTKDAIQLVARQPLLPGVGGSASGNGGAGGILLDTALVPDPGTGLVYQIAMWSLYRQVLIEIALCWGVGVVNPQNMVLLLG